MGAHYSDVYDWELVTIIGPGDASLNNPYTGETPEGAPPVITPIQSMTGQSDGGDIELHIVVWADDGT
eukprot:464951-Pleurochrysis_carterae.AAC.1